MKHDPPEVLSRVRRIETRLTQLMVGLGVPTQAQKPKFDAGSRTVTVPSIHSSLQEILDSIPEGWQGPVHVCIGSRQVATVALHGAV